MYGSRFLRRLICFRFLEFKRLSNFVNTDASFESSEAIHHKLASSSGKDKVII